MEFLAVLAGVAIVAASPLVPGLRPTAKKVVAGGPVSYTHLTLPTSDLV